MLGPPQEHIGGVLWIRTKIPIELVSEGRSFWLTDRWQTVENIISLYNFELQLTGLQFEQTYFM